MENDRFRSALNRLFKRETYQTRQAPTVICVPLAANHWSILFGAVPTLCSLVFKTGSLPPNSESLNWEIISLRSGIYRSAVFINGAPKKKTQLIENTRTIPSIVTLTTLSPSSVAPEDPTICTPILTVVCCPNRTIFVPDRQSQQTRALSAPALTRLREERATARIPFKCPASCCRGVKVTEENKCTRLE